MTTTKHEAIQAGEDLLQAHQSEGCLTCHMCEAIRALIDECLRLETALTKCNARARGGNIGWTPFSNG